MATRRTLRQLADRERYTANLLAVYRSATEEQRQRGTVWYQHARAQCEVIASTFGFDLRSVVYAIAALSPLKSWEQNVKDARQVAHAVKHTRRVPTVTFPRQVAVAVECLRGALHTLSGPKVNSFAEAILGTTSAAVIDGWMMRAAGWDRTYPPRSPGQYNVLADALCRAAAIASLPVTTFQAIVWVTVREQ